MIDEEGDNYIKYWQQYDSGNDSVKYRGIIVIAVVKNHFDKKVLRLLRHAESPAAPRARMARDPTSGTTCPANILSSGSSL